MAKELSRQKIEAIELLVFSPSLQKKEVAKRVGVLPQTLSKWLSQDDFSAALHARCKQRFKLSERIAVEGMLKLAEEGNFQANKYVLDYMDYKPVDKIEQQVTSITVNVEDEPTVDTVDTVDERKEVNLTEANGAPQD